MGAPDRQWDDLGTLGRKYKANTYPTEQISYPYCTKVLSFFYLNLEAQARGGGGLFLLSFYVFINFNYTYLWGIYSIIMNVYSVVKIIISLNIKFEINLWYNHIHLWTQLFKYSMWLQLHVHYRYWSNLGKQNFHFPIIAFVFRLQVPLFSHS